MLVCEYNETPSHLDPLTSSFESVTVQYGKCVYVESTTPHALLIRSHWRGTLDSRESVTPSDYWVKNTDMNDDCSILDYLFPLDGVKVYIGSLENPTSRSNSEEDTKYLYGESNSQSTECGYSRTNCLCNDANSSLSIVCVDSTSFITQSRFPDIDYSTYESRLSEFWVEEQIDTRNAVNGSLTHFLYGPTLSVVYASGMGADVYTCGWNDIPCVSVYAGLNHSHVNASDGMELCGNDLKIALVNDIHTSETDMIEFIGDHYSFTLSPSTEDGTIIKINSPIQNRLPSSIAHQKLLHSPELSLT